jgi:hypothetical protein
MTLYLHSIVISSDVIALIIGEHEAGSGIELEINGHSTGNDD